MLKTRLLTASALVTAAALGSPVFAQSPGQEPAAQAASTAPIDDATDVPVTGATEATGEVTVTGSRIRRPNTESPVPVTTVAGEAFFEQGRNNIGDTLNDLPQLRNTFSQQNIGAGVGVAGLSLLDLRGLGTSRTLVLVNGRRHVGSDALVTTVAVDINSIPADLIERVEIITGGSSAVYGSDAIAGVVNFVLRRNYDGFQVRANAAIAEDGFGANQYISAMAGKNFAGGRGNVALHAEYARQERVFGSDIPWYGRANGFSVVDVDSAGLTGNSDGFVDRAFFRDLRSGTANRYGLIPVNQRVANPICGTGLAPTNGQPGTVAANPAQNGQPYSCSLLFTPNGRATAQTGTRIGTGPNAVYVGGNGQTGREGILLSVLAPQQRYNANFLGHFAFSPAFEVFAEAKYSRVTGAGVNVASEFINGQYTQFDYRERIRLDNPYLNPTDSATIANAILASGCNTSFTAVCSAAAGTTQPTRQARADGGVIGGPLNAADIAAINAGTYRFAFAKAFLDAGLRDQLFKRETYRGVAGVRGTFNDDWTYEISGSYAEFHERVRNVGFIDKQRFQLSIDAALNPMTGTIQCRAQFDPAARIGRNNPFDQARLAADIAACVPYNPFGDVGNPAQSGNAAATNYFTINSVDNAKITQTNAVAYLSGDTSGFLNMPGGPLRFSIGGEYRRDKARYVQDPFTNDPASYTTFLSGLGFDAPATKTKEAFGEVQVPLLKNLPLIDELSISGAGRVSDYNNSAGTVFSYNYGAVYAPIQDIRFRVQYGRAVRAPNVSETATPITPNFANNFIDPCRANALANGSQFRAANCATALGTLINNPAFAQQPTYNLKVLSGSNPILTEETSDSWTIGGVIQPRFVPNLSVSVDYYNIKVNNVITAVTAQTIANSCYDLATLDNPFCALIQRNGAATGPDSELPGQILSNTLLQAPQNLARLQRRGIDTQVSYRANFSENVGLGLNAVYTHIIDNSNYTNPADPTFENVLKKEIGNPADEFVVNADLRFGDFTLGYRGHFIGKMYLNTYEDYNSVGGRAPENADYADIKQYPIVTYHALRFEWNLRDLNGLADSFQFYGGVDNIFDKKPPYGLTATVGGGAIYDVRGRNLYAGFRARF